MSGRLFAPGTSGEIEQGDASPAAAETEVSAAPVEAGKMCKDEVRILTATNIMTAEIHFRRNFETHPPV